MNGQFITEAEIRAEMAAIRAYRERGGPELSLEEHLQLRDEAIDTLLERAMLYQEARRLELSPNPEEISTLAATLAPPAYNGDGCRAGTDPAILSAEAERQLIFARLLAHWTRNVKPPKSAEVRDYYRAHAKEFQRPEGIHAAHIVKHAEQSDPEANRAILEQVRERLLAGEDFNTLAAEFSDCPDKSGDLGFFHRGVMVDEFDAAISEMPLNEYTPVFETPFGLHIAVVRERRPAGPIPLSEVSAEIENGLHRGKQDREVGRRLEALRKTTKVQVLS